MSGAHRSASRRFCFFLPPVNSGGAVGTVSVSYTHLDVYKRQAQRIVEVLCEESALQGPENPVREVKDGSIDFDNVSFKYAKTAERMALSGIDLHIRSG